MYKQEKAYHLCKLETGGHNAEERSELTSWNQNENIQKDEFNAEFEENKINSFKVANKMEKERHNRTQGTSFCSLRALYLMSQPGT